MSVWQSHDDQLKLWLSLLISCRRKHWSFLWAQLAGAVQITAATKVPFRWSSRCTSGECSPMQTLSPQDQARPGPKQEKPWNMLSVDAHTTFRVWTATCPNSIWANWSNSSVEGMLLQVVLHTTASSTLSLKIQGKPGAWRLGQEDQWEVDQDMQDGGSSLNCFGPKAVLCYSEGPALVQQQPQETELQWRLFPVTTGKRCWSSVLHLALCGSLRQLWEISLAHWVFFFTKSCVLEGNFVILGRSRRRWVRAWKLTG